MRVLVFLLLSGIAHYLLASWLASVSPRARKHRDGVMAAALAASTVLALLRLVGHWFGGPLVHDVLAVAMVELTVVVLLLVPLGLLALATRAVASAFDRIRPPSSDGEATTRVGRRQAIERVTGGAIAAVTTSTLGWGVVRGRHAFAIEEVVVRLRGLPRVLDGYTIVQVSDVHVGAFVGDRELDEGFALVRRLRPDLVVATGDLVDVEAERIGALVARLRGVGARDGAYAVLGNHDHYAGAIEVADAIRASEVGLLDNRSVRLRSGDGGGFVLGGVDDLAGRTMPSTGHTGPDLRRAFEGQPRELPRILLAHQPQYFLESRGRIDLQLSGHTHGGQINPGFRPVATFMPFVSGRYEQEGSTLWVNRGYGVSGPPSRVGAPPEVTKIVLVAG